jgi:hypothetical protein
MYRHFFRKMLAIYSCKLLWEISSSRITQEDGDTSVNQDKSLLGRAWISIIHFRCCLQYGQYYLFYSALLVCGWWGRLEQFMVTFQRMSEIIVKESKALPIKSYSRQVPPLSLSLSLSQETIHVLECYLTWFQIPRVLIPFPGPKLFRKWRRCRS